MNKKKILAVSLKLFALSSILILGSCFMFQQRPWQNDTERIKFMLKIVGEITDDVPNHCIDTLTRQLKNRNKNASARLDSNFHTFRPIQSSNSVCQSPAKTESRSCSQALATCGNCHIPRVNNCNYQFVYGPNKDKPKRLVGQVRKVTSGFIHVSERNLTPKKSQLKDSSGPALIKIPRSQIHKSIWLNGADPLVEWWDFKKFGRRGKVARRMLHLATKHKVACINCHKQHGDFRLTKEGKIFKDTGEVIRKIPLSHFTGKSEHK